MGVKAGLDPRIMLDVINSGTGRNTATEDKFGRVVLPRLFNLGFTTGLMTKDLKLCLAEGKALGVPMEVAQAVTRMLEIACDEIGPDEEPFVNDQRVPIPREPEDDYTDAMARRRREFVAERTGAKLDHVTFR